MQSIYPKLTFVHFYFTVVSYDFSSDDSGCNEGCQLKA